MKSPEYAAEYNEFIGNNT